MVPIHFSEVALGWIQPPSCQNGRATPMDELQQSRSYLITETHLDEFRVKVCSLGTTGRWRGGGSGVVREPPAPECTASVQSRAVLPLTAPIQPPSTRPCASFAKHCST